MIDTAKLPPEKKVVIDSLGQIVAEKRQRFEMLAAQNVYGLDEVKRAHASMEYAQAQADLWNAEGQLRDALVAAKWRNPQRND